MQFREAAASLHAWPPRWSEINEMKIIVLSLVLIGSAMAVTFGDGTVSEKVPEEVIRHAGSLGLGKEGSLLEIVSSKNGKHTWSLTWLVAYPSTGASVTITKDDYLKDKTWFSFVESPSRVWFFDGIDELMLAERTAGGISQQYAIWRGEALELFDQCPPEVIDALPDALPTK